MAFRHPRRARLAVAAAVSVVAVATAALAARETPQARERHVFVSVVDSQGNPVTGLDQSEFVVREDGVAREVLRVAPATERMTIAILVDDSQAATRAIADLRKGLLSFVTAMTQGNEIALITFGERPTIVVDYTATLDQLTAGINRLFARPGSGAHLLEALIETSHGLRGRDAPRPVIVAIATEGPEFSNDYYVNVLDALHESHAMLDALVLTTGQAADASVDEIRNRNIVLAEGPATTGGRREFLLSESAITPKLEQLANDLKHQYRLTYARPESLIPPRRLEVTVRKAGLIARAPTVLEGR